MGISLPKSPKRLIATSLGMMMLAMPTPAFASPNDVIDPTKSSVQTNLTSYHGTKPQYMDSVLGGIKKPASGSQGNNDPNWKGFYSADSKCDAAGYAVDEEDTLSGKAGGVVKVTYPGRTKVLSLTSTDANVIKKELELNPNEPLMDQVAKPDFIERYGDGADRVVLSLPIAEDSSGVEYISNWNQAEALDVKLEVDFRPEGRKGQDAMYEYIANGCR